jgi:carboxyl-terminal processing protease
MIGRFVNPAMGFALYEDSGRAGDGGELTGQPILAGDVTVYDLPLAVLVDGGTASAAEIVAGALRDYGRAVLIGETTFGKGSVQRIHEFPDGSSLRVTIGEWLTPQKTFLTGHGLTPDVIVATGSPMTTDIQLEAAEQYLLTAGWSSLALGW